MDTISEVISMCIKLKGILLEDLQRTALSFDGEIEDKYKKRVNSEIDILEQIIWNLKNNI